MYSFLLAIIYLAFISLGLPDSLLGSAWPVMYGQMNVSVSFAGVIYMIIASGTIVSSLMSDTLTRRFGAGLVTALSVTMTAAALFGFSLSNSVILLCVFAVPYGLGAGAVDAALNNYVALHYSSRHMSWLHCFWGVGATISPHIMSYCLAGGLSWNTGYRTVSLIQVALALALFASLPLWSRLKAPQTDKTRPHAKRRGLRQVIKIPGVKFVMLGFFAYCALESTIFLWASSYLVLTKGIDTDTAARYGAMFFYGITSGRFLCGFISNRVGDKNMIRAGVIIIAAGLAVLFLPSAGALTLAGLVVIGLGCAPVYPSIIHQTPQKFGAENSQAIIGIQMASAYTGSTLMPPLFGYIAGHIGIALLPAYLLVFAVVMAVMLEAPNRPGVSSRVNTT